MILEEKLIEQIRCLPFDFSATNLTRDTLCELHLTTEYTEYTENGREISVCSVCSVVINFNEMLVPL